MILENIPARFDDVIKKTFATLPEVRQFLLNHERKNLAIEKTKEQIKIAELSNFGKKFEARHVLECIEMCAKCFCNAALNHKKEQVLSAAEYQRRVDEAEKLKNTEEEYLDDQKELKASEKLIVFRPGSVGK